MFSMPICCEFCSFETANRHELLCHLKTVHKGSYSNVKDSAVKFKNCIAKSIAKRFGPGFLLHHFTELEQTVKAEARSFKYNSLVLIPDHFKVRTEKKAGLG